MSLQIMESRLSKMLCYRCYSSKTIYRGRVENMEQGTPIKQAAKELVISIQSSFDWCYKILASKQSTLATKLKGVIECHNF